MTKLVCDSRRLRDPVTMRCSAEAAYRVFKPKPGHPDLVLLALVLCAEHARRHVPNGKLPTEKGVAGWDHGWSVWPIRREAD